MAQIAALLSKGIPGVDKQPSKPTRNVVARLFSPSVSKAPSIGVTDKKLSETSQTEPSDLDKIKERLDGYTDAIERNERKVEKLSDNVNDIGFLINTLSETVDAVKSSNDQIIVNQNSQTTAFENQKDILQKISDDVKIMVSNIVKHSTILGNLKQSIDKKQRVALLQAQQELTKAEEAQLEAKKDAVPVTSRKQKQEETKKQDNSIFGMIGSLLSSITGLVTSIFSLPTKIAGAFKALMSFKSVFSILPHIARFFLMNPIGIALLAGASLLTLLAKDKNPEETTKGIINAGNPDVAMATAITELSQAPNAEIERKKQNILADRPSSMKSFIPWKNSKLQQEYLDQIGWDEKTGTTAQERQQKQASSGGMAAVRRIDNQLESATTQPQQSATKVASETQGPAGAVSTGPTKSTDQSTGQMAVPDKQTTYAEQPSTAPVAPTPTTGSNISQASTNVESLYSRQAQSSQGGIVVNTSNDSFNAHPKKRAPIPSPVANRGSIDNFAFSA